MGLRRVCEVENGQKAKRTIEKKSQSLERTARRWSSEVAVSSKGHLSGQSSRKRVKREKRGRWFDEFESRAPLSSLRLLVPLPPPLPYQRWESPQQQRR